MTTYQVAIKRRERLNEQSDKETYHLVLDTSSANITYNVGDCVAIYPHNDPELVDSILAHFSSDGSESVKDRDGRLYSFSDFLQRKANLIRVPKELGKGHHVLDALRKRDDLTPQTLAPLLSPMLPRFYSIASSRASVGPEIHLTVAINENPPHFPTKFGTCSHFLCKRAPLQEPIVDLYLHPAKDFYLTKKSFQRPIIMVGPGTGIAPFRGFLQERLIKGCRENWLFFGERRESHDYYYAEEWKEACERGFLRLDTAFSRDQNEKIYVQHRLQERAEEIWEWLQKGAYLYVCGDAKKMAKAVDEALRTIVEKIGRTDPKEYIKNLRAEKRYLRDIY